MGAHARKNRGFTLIETLIVVGVVAVLAAVSLPLFMDAIDKANCAADEAYERAAMAKINAMYANGEIDVENVQGFVYHPETDSLVEASNKEATIPLYGQCSRHKDGYIFISLNPTTTEINLYWALVTESGYPDGFDPIPHYI